MPGGDKVSWRPGDPDRRQEVPDLKEFLLMQRDVADMQKELRQHVQEQGDFTNRMEHRLSDMRELLLKHSNIIDNMVETSRSKAIVWTAIATSVAQATLWSAVFAIGWGLWLLVKSEINKP